MAEEKNKKPTYEELEKSNKELRDTVEARSKLLDYYVNRCLGLEQQSILDKAQTKQEEQT